jgi:dephospho-CoA kinase
MDGSDAERRGVLRSRVTRRKRLSESFLSSPRVKVVCVTGMPGCGKDELLAVARDLGFSIVRMGDVVREEATRRGLPITDEAVGGMAHTERQAHGFGIWAERTLPRIRGEYVLVDGLRGRAELDVFRKAFGVGLVVVAVHASPKTRYERMMRRRRPDDAMSLEAFRARDVRELSWGLGDVIAIADLVLVNEGSLEDFRRQARAALERLHG